MLIFFRRAWIVSLFFSFLLLSSTGRAQVTVSSGQAALALAQKLTGPGIAVSNASLTCPTDARGIFKITGSNPLGIDSGIVLTTGRAATAGAFYGINGAESLLSSSNNGASGDAQLNALANSTTRDACKLEFDLVPKGDTISFDYVFGSEEYNNSTCGNYNDAFAFFISGPGIAGQDNMALVPGTSIPVTVNTINNGIPGPQGNIANCTSMGLGSPFTAYYNDNTNGTLLTYKGFTKVLKALHAVTPCSTYRLKLMIADGGNYLYDSGVFIKAGSLKTTTYNATATGANGSTGNPPAVYRGCAPGRFAISRSQKKPQSQTVKLIISGSAQNGIDYNQIADSVVIAANDSVAYLNINALVTLGGGPKTVKIAVISPYSCNGPEVVDTATLQILDAPTASILTPDTTICEGSGFTVRVSGDATHTYNWTPSAGISNPSAPAPFLNPAATTTYVMTVSVPGSGCAVVKDTVQVQVQDKPDVSAGNDQKVCALVPVTLTGTVNPSHGNYTYSWSGPNGFSASTPTVFLPQPTAAATGYYTFSVSGEGCGASTDSAFLTVQALPAEPQLTNPVEICVNGTLPLNPGGDQSLLWYQAPTGGTGTPDMPVVDPHTEGLYTFYVSQVKNGCEGPRKEQVIRVEKCCEDQVFIPSAFSPNGDGRNDRWTLHKGPDDVVLQVIVLNRYGQVVYEGRNRFDWDGTFRGQLLDPGTYFYQVLISCHKGQVLEKKGDLLLLR